MFTSFCMKLRLCQTLPPSLSGQPSQKSVMSFLVDGPGCPEYACAALVVPHGVWAAAVVGEADRRVDRPAQLAVLGDARALARQLAYLVGVARTAERIKYRVIHSSSYI